MACVGTYATFGELGMGSLLGEVGKEVKFGGHVGVFFGFLNVLWGL